MYAAGRGALARCPLAAGAARAAFGEDAEHFKQVLPQTGRAAQRAARADRGATKRSCALAPRPSLVRIGSGMPHSLWLRIDRRKREADRALVEKAKATVAWQLLEAELVEAQAQIQRKHALRRTAKSFAQVRDECNVEVARTRYEIEQRHFRLWEQRGLPLSRLFPSDGRTPE